jgi:tetratricopeptide (TPR) repeat protein
LVASLAIGSDALCQASTDIIDGTRPGGSTTDGGALYHARLADFYATQGRRAEAMEELRNAERFGPTDPLKLEQVIGKAYLALHEFGLAQQHLQAALDEARAQGVPKAETESLGKAVSELKERLTPQYITAGPPKEYTPQSLNRSLSEKLSKRELELVVNPLDATAAMGLWAQQLVAGATNELDKAKRIYDGLIVHINTGTETPRTRTAHEVFVVWKQPGTFMCQEYTYLYIALARSVGLRAFWVDVGELWQGSKIGHCCAAVFLPGKAILVDPAQVYFGPSHKKFVIYDDLQVLAWYLSLRGGLEESKIALKLCPDLPVVNYLLVGRLIGMHEISAAEKAVDKMLRFDPKGWMTAQARGELALEQKQFRKAEGAFRRSVELHPKTEVGWAGLAYVYVKLDKLRLAKAAMETCLKSGEGAEVLPDGNETVIKLEREIQAYDDAVNYSPPNAEVYLSRAESFIRDDELDRAIADLEVAVRLAPNETRAHFRLGQAFLAKRDYKGAVDALREAIELCPTNGDALLYFGIAHQRLSQFNAACQDYRRAVSIDPNNVESLSSLALLLASCPDGFVRNGKEALALARKACKLTKWRDGFCLEALAASFAAIGDFKSAIKYQEQACSKCDEFDPWFTQAQEALELYRQHKPRREIPVSSSQSEELGNKSDSL